MPARSRHLFRMPESTLGIEVLPPQSDVYIPRHLNQVSEPGDEQVRQRNDRSAATSTGVARYRQWPPRPRSFTTRKPRRWSGTPSSSSEARMPSSIQGSSSSAPCTTSGKVPGQACGDGRSVGIGAQILKTLRFPSTLGLCRTRRAP